MATSSFNKVANSGTSYIFVGQANNNMTTAKITSAGALDTAFNTVGYVTETVNTGTSIAYDLIVNGTALAVGGQTSPAGTIVGSIINYNANTGARNPALGNNGYQKYPELTVAILYSITNIGKAVFAAGSKTP
jgi:hypothetical protein